MEKDFPLRVSLVRMSCDKCVDGELLPTEEDSEDGVVHACSKCEEKSTYEFKYPTLRYTILAGTVEEPPILEESMWEVVDEGNS